MFVIQSRAGLFSAVEEKYGKAELDRLQETILKIEGDILAYFGTKTAMPGAAFPMRHWPS